MEFFKNNKKTIIVLGIVILIFVTNGIVNSIAKSKIKNELESITKDLENFSYDNISYSYISSTLSFENIYIGENDNYVKIEEFSIEINPNALPSKKEIEEWDFETKISDLNLSVENFTAVEDDLLFEIKSSDLSFNGNFNSKKESLNTNRLTLDLEGLDISDGRDEAILKSLEIKFKSDEYIDFEDLEDKAENITDLGNIFLEIKADDYTFSKSITKELDLDEIGISELSGKIFDVIIEKEDDEIDFDFQLASNLIGNIEIETNVDFAKDLNNPIIELEIELENLNRDFNRILKRSKLKETKRGFKLDFEGTFNELQKSIY